MGTIFYLTFPDIDRWDKELRIIDISGQEVISDKIPVQSQEMMINTQELAEGIYFVRIEMGLKLGTHKIVVRH
ncbi:MAG: T9SS type A sorting domain-containing protein [Bacteroidia bacterium]|nr:T9SS type A sorting domain-containing protein [Bacteroidia bacterium]